jgi:hypothetical protein
MRSRGKERKSGRAICGDVADEMRKRVANSEGRGERLATTGGVLSGAVEESASRGLITFTSMRPIMKAHPFAALGALAEFSSVELEEFHLD